VPDFKAQMHQKSNFGCGSAPDTAGGAYSALPDPQLDLRGPTSKGRGREWREGLEKKGEKWRG